MPRKTPNDFVGQGGQFEARRLTIGTIALVCSPISPPVPLDSGDDAGFDVDNITIKRIDYEQVESITLIN